MDHYTNQSTEKEQLLYIKFYKTIKKSLEELTFLHLAIIVAVFSFLYVLPIILTNTFYIDDMNRTVFGYDWDRDARFISSKIMHLLSFQKDIVYSGYPFSNIFSSFLLAFSGFLLCYSIGIRHKAFLFIGSLLLLTCPFLLEILWYKFDSLPISLSLFFAVFPFVFYNKPIKFGIVSAFSLFLIFGLYQTTAFSYSIILTFFSIKYIWKKEYKTVIMNGLIGVISFVISFVCHSELVKILEIQIIDEQRSEFIFNQPNFSFLLKERFEGFKVLFYALYTSSYKFLIGFLLVFVCVGIISLLIKTKLTLERCIQLIIIVGLVFFAILLAIGINLFVMDFRWEPRAMIGYAFLFYATLFAIYYIPKYKSIIAFIAFTPIVYYSFLISSQTGVFIKNQEEFSDFVINQISTEVMKYDHLKLVINGEIKNAERNRTVNYDVLPITIKLAPKYENYSWYWGRVRMNKFGIFSDEFVDQKEREEVLSSYESLPLIQSNSIYELRIKEPYAVVKFK